MPPKIATPKKSAQAKGKVKWSPASVTISDGTNKPANKTWALLTHASICRSLQCKSFNCKKMKVLLIHEKGCVITAKGGCFSCQRIWALLHDHVEQCTVKECPVPHCVSIRECGCDGRGRKVSAFFWG
jgi:hypothetical protein